MKLFDYFTRLFKKPTYWKFIIDIDSDISNIIARERIFDISREIIIDKMKAADDSKPCGLFCTQMLVNSDKFGFFDYRYWLHRKVPELFCNEALVGLRNIQFTIYVYYNKDEEDVTKYNAKFGVKLFKEYDLDDWHVGTAEIIEIKHPEEGEND